MASPAVKTGEPLLTIEEFEKLPANGERRELIRGWVVSLNPPFPWHGYICGKAARILGGFVDAQDLGYVVTNDSGVVTGRNPDTLHGADLAYYSYHKVPKGTMSRRGYLAVAPDLVIEVRSPDDTWAEILAKVNEYLRAGVGVVCVLDPDRTTATVFQAGQPEVTLAAEDDLTFPAVLPGFVVGVGRFFD